ncbi:hypothetical protein MGAST_05065 [Mycobacterium gastri 'Wayne']|nr:hypothetical protein MGAST_05065 [Mycobacterium gastri 'Wayne']
MHGLTCLVGHRHPATSGVGAVKTDDPGRVRRSVAAPTSLQLSNQ